MGGLMAFIAFFASSNTCNLGENTQDPHATASTVCQNVGLGRAGSEMVRREERGQASELPVCEQSQTSHEQRAQEKQHRSRDRRCRHQPK